MKLEVLHVPDCPNLEPLLDRLHAVTNLPVLTHQIHTDEEAAARGMAGSPTLLVDGVDPFGAAGPCDFGVSCRIYRGPDGQMTGAPSVEQLREALSIPGPAEVLSRWRTRARRLDPVERAVHQAVLRAFATTGGPATSGELDPVVAGTGTSTVEVLQSLHDGDAIRVTPDGVIAVAYPFSANPTRHRVRIGDRVDAYAMCAIDALGIAAMLGQDTAISSVDVTTGQPVTVTTTGGRTVWDPATAVVFIGVGAGGGPTADCCCDYLNFFNDPATANAWASNHPEVPGQILTQPEAEVLGIQLFQPLLAH